MLGFFFAGLAAFFFGDGFAVLPETNASVPFCERFDATSLCPFFFGSMINTLGPTGFGYRVDEIARQM